MSSNNESSSEDDSSPSSAINYEISKDYWKNVDASMDGMLGGLTEVNTHDVNESRALLKRLLQHVDTKDDSKTLRCLDCGAGIGRVTKYVLSLFFDEIDLLEQNEAFLEQSKIFLNEIYDKKICKVYLQGIHEFEPDPNIQYDCIWGQWVFGYVTDDDLLNFLIKCVSLLKPPHGFIVIKDNVTKGNESISHYEDGSYTRCNERFLKIFARVGDVLRLKCTVKQKKHPRDLLPVRMYVLTLVSKN